jgi:hypothetical protein
MKKLKTPSCSEIWDIIESIEEAATIRSQIMYVDGKPFGTSAATHTTMSLIRQLSAVLGDLFHDFERQWLDHSSEHHVCEDCGFTINKNKHGSCPASPE